MKNKEGITLIALVITIIVLLILAGVSISMLTSDNGIISQAANASEKIDDSADKENIQLAIQDYKISKYNSDKKSLVEVLQSKDWCQSASYNVVTKTTTVVMEDSGKKYNILEDGSIIEENSDINSAESASSIEASDYGKILANYTVDGYDGTWEIFYADNSNVYLITTDVVNNPKYNSKDLAGAVNDGTYSTGSSLLSDNVKYVAAEKWLASWIDSGYSSDTINMQTTLFMLDSTGVWNNVYKNEYADYAIGGPTLDLLCESINKVQGTTYKANPTNINGYPQTISSGITLNEVWNRGEDYWLCCPSANNPSYMRRVNSAGKYLDSPNYVNSVGFRPIVCLNSNLSFERSEDNTYFEIVMN